MKRPTNKIWTLSQDEIVNAVRDSTSLKQVLNKLDIFYSNRNSEILFMLMCEYAIDYSHIEKRSGFKLNTRSLEKIKLKIKEPRPVGYPNYNARDKTARKSGLNVERLILKDSKMTDKVKGLDNDLDLDFIKNQIKFGCFYCKNVNIRMTLDRVDNTIGHTKSNVKPACVRCNIIRMNMPYEAWLNLSKAMEDTVKKGLFGDWVP